MDVEETVEAPRVAWWPILAMAVVIFVGLGALTSTLYRVQIMESNIFQYASNRQSIRRVQIPGNRGRIYDRNGVCLADNRASCCIVYYVDELRCRGAWSNTIHAVDASITRLSDVLGLPRTVTKEAIAKHVKQSLPMPLIVWRDVDQETLARWAERAEEFPGADVLVLPERVYPQGRLAAHVLGYVGRDRPALRPGERFHFYLPEMVGKAGIEKMYNTLLTGTTGERLIRVDARGYKHATWDDGLSVAGQDVTLTLDVTLQAALERELEGLCGAGVVLNPQTGEVLALASAPGFDPNDFVPSVSHGLWRKLSTDPQTPLFNRAIQGRYAPGSTFKPVTAMAALAAGVPLTREFACSGVFERGAMRLKCTSRYGHGVLGMREALKRSCNPYFCALADEAGYPAIYDEAHALGFGERTGIDLPAESAGLLPSESWKLRVMQDSWWVGDTCQIGIGQGLLLATPLQMATVAATLGNGGRIYKPYVRWQAGAVEPMRNMPWREDALALVRAGMQDVVTHGTGRRVLTREHNGEKYVLKVTCAGKTGTAEVDIGGERMKNAWILAFAPFEHPTIAVAMVIERGESGGLTTAPKAHAVLAAAFGETKIDVPVPPSDVIPLGED